MNNEKLRINYNQRISFFDRVKVALLKGGQIIDDDTISYENTYGLLGVAVLMQDLDILIKKTEKKFYANIILILVRVEFSSRDIFNSHETQVIECIKKSIVPIETFYTIDGKGTYGVVVYGTDKVAVILKNRILKALHLAEQGVEFNNHSVTIKATHLGCCEDYNSGVDLIFTASTKLDKMKH